MNNRKLINYQDIDHTGSVYVGGWVSLCVKCECEEVGERDRQRERDTERERETFKHLFNH